MLVSEMCSQGRSGATLWDQEGHVPQRDTLHPSARSGGMAGLVRLRGRRRSTNIYLSSHSACKFVAVTLLEKKKLRPVGKEGSTLPGQHCPPKPPLRDAELSPHSG